MTQDLDVPAVPETPSAIGGKGLTIAGDLATMFAALSAAQASYGPLKKTKENPYFSSKYADLADVLDACLPALQAQGFALLQPPVRAAGSEGWTMFTILGHKSGGYFQLEATIPPTEANGWQKFGSAVTYCRRYQVSALLGVAAEPDDDGNAASDAQPRGGARANSQPTPPQPKAQAKPPPTPKAPSQPAPQNPADANGIASKQPVPDSGGPAPADKGESAPPQAPEASTSTPEPADDAPMGPDLSSQVRTLWFSRLIDGKPVNGASADAFCKQLLGKGVKAVTTVGEARKLMAALEVLPALEVSSSIP